MALNVGVQLITTQGFQVICSRQPLGVRIAGFLCAWGNSTFCAHGSREVVVVLDILCILKQRIGGFGCRHSLWLLLLREGSLNTRGQLRWSGCRTKVPRQLALILCSSCRSFNDVLE